MFVGLGAVMDGMDMWESALAGARATIAAWREEADRLERTIEDLIEAGCGSPPGAPLSSTSGIPRH